MKLMLFFILAQVGLMWEWLDWLMLGFGHFLQIVVLMFGGGLDLDGVEFF